MRCFPALALPLAFSLTAATPPGAPRLGLPIACQLSRDCEIQHYVDRDPGPATKDYRCGRHTYEGHKGIDIRLYDMAAQRRGVDVIAAAPGRVIGVRNDVPDISVRAANAPSISGRECGNGVVLDHGGGWTTQYCHLARGSVTAKPGETVAAGASLGKVGLSGATEFPHLHFQVAQGGKIVDPFRPAADASCGGSAEALWTADAARQLAYKDGVILNAGFAGASFDMAALEEARIPALTSNSPYLVGYGRGIGLTGGDVVEVSLIAPDGSTLARNATAPLDRDKAQYLSFVGKKRPPSGWPTGAYAVEVRVLRGGKPVLRERRTVRM